MLRPARLCSRIAVDLAATAVVQTGKIAVKGTGAVVRAVIPDGDNDDKKATQKTKQAQKQREQAARAQAQQPPHPISGSLKRCHSHRSHPCSLKTTNHSEPRQNKL